MIGDRRQIRDIVFDLGGVLVDWNPRYLFRRHLGRDPADVERFLAQVCTREWHSRLDGGEPFEAARRRLAGAFPEFGDWVAEYLSDWPKMFAGAFPEAVKIFYSLKARGFRLHALSNYPGEQIAFLYREFAFMREFDTVILSGLVGVQKPEAAIFRYLRERIGARPCLFIDDRAENVAAARRCGIRAIEYAGADTDADALLDSLLALAAGPR